MMNVFRFAVVGIVLLAGFCAHAQVVLNLSEQIDKRIPLAVPAFSAEVGYEGLGQELAQIVAYDLDFTGLFSILPRAKYPASFRGFTPAATQIDFKGWRNAKVECVVYANLIVTANSIVAECRLFDVLSAQQIVGKRLEAEHKWSRILAHQFSDEIVRFLTGIPGIATSQICFSAGGQGKKEIYVADYDGANVRQVTHHKSVSILPKVSPDGLKIAYLSYKERYPYLYVLDLQTGKSTPLSRRVGLNAAPAWAPDGNTIALVLSKDGNSEIYLRNADGTGGKRLTNNRATDTSPTFSPDGSQIAFISERGGYAQVYAMDINGRNARRLSHQGGRAYEPKWSPNGKYIVYVVERAGEGLEIYRMDADGSNPAALTSSVGSNESPSWSPDSRHVIFTSTRTGFSQLWTVNAETGQERRVPSIGLRCQGPYWGPRRM